MYKLSPFHCLYDSGNNQALLNCTGFDNEKFKFFWIKLSTIFDNYTFDERSGLIRPEIMRKGRHRNLDAIGGFGLVLIWYRTRGTCSRNLAICFRQRCTPLYKWIKFGQKILLTILINDNETELKISSDEEIDFFTKSVLVKNILIVKMFGELLTS